MNVLFFVLLFLLIFILIPINFKVKINYDVLTNSGVVSIFLINLRIALAYWDFGINSINIKRKSKQPHQFPLFNTGGYPLYSDNLILQIVNNLRLRSLKFYAKAGVQDNAFLTSLACVGLNFPSALLFKKVYLKKPDSHLLVNVYPDFFENSFMTAATASVSINIILFVFCLLSAYFKTKRSKK